MAKSFGLKDPMATANAAAVTIIVIYIVCAGAVLVAPDFAMGIAGSWFHGIDITKIAALNITLASFIWGLITSTIGTWLVGYLFALLYNKFVEK